MRESEPAVLGGPEGQDMQAQDAIPAGGPDDRVHRTVDVARRKLLVSAQKFRQMLLDHIASNGGAPPPEAASPSLKALVNAFSAAGRGEELAAAAVAIAKARSFAYDFT